ncbi:ATP-binding protein [Mesobacillus maritimus]|uniref:histidine kinase n=1 Tax=Mesobacillus maritimus TaxID=1643336 RepID=A0ABS7K7M2_9BACI|nr:ATP-binding protein [Mesobacillus maritimus]MBY0098268.1 GHKL domain-containing protein [Mesobacillus maritimus]
MNDGTREEVLRIEEIKAIKLFTLLFYFVYIGYDFVYYYLFAYFNHKDMGLPDKGLGYYMYGALFLLLPIVLYLIKKGQPFLIKYIYFYAFLLLDFTNNLLIYWGTDSPYMNGNFVEVLFLIFSPIFVNKRFFWIISISMVLKYVAYGVLFHSNSVLLPIMLVLFLALFGWIVLTRFISYINGMNLAYEEAKQKEKLAVVGQMATSIAHEIKNPLSSLKGFTQLQLEKEKSEENFYPIMLNEIDRINLIVSDLLILGKPTGTSKSNVSIEGILNYVVSVIEPQASRQFITIQTDIDETIPHIYCDENQLKQVFLNLLKNSVESMMDGGNIYIKARFKDNQFIISVQDEGEGIPQAQIEKIGAPFYTTKPNGTGLGLMVTKKIIEEHGGKLEINSVPNDGTTIDVILYY